ncbi:MAG: hypothetical protein QXT45_02375 [Candidatus Bilamarchaeaceae archaeon]
MMLTVPIYLPQFARLAVSNRRLGLRLIANQRYNSILNIINIGKSGASFPFEMGSVTSVFSGMRRDELARIVAGTKIIVLDGIASGLWARLVRIPQIIGVEACDVKWAWLNGNPYQALAKLFEIPDDHPSLKSEMLKFFTIPNFWEIIDKKLPGHGSEFFSRLGAYNIISSTEVGRAILSTVVKETIALAWYLMDSGIRVIDVDNDSVVVMADDLPPVPEWIRPHRVIVHYAEMRD